MTSHGLRFLEYEENKRANQARETETHRANVAGETETKRSNLAKEAENNRHNVETEVETKRSNLAREAETNRHNLKTELQTDTQISESVRHNKATESAEMSKQAEQKRHNITSEKIDEREASAKELTAQSKSDETNVKVLDSLSKTIPELETAIRLYYTGDTQRLKDDLAKLNDSKLGKIGILGANNVVNFKRQLDQAKDALPVLLKFIG